MVEVTQGSVDTLGEVAQALMAQLASADVVDQHGTTVKGSTLYNVETRTGLLGDARLIIGGTTAADRFKFHIEVTPDINSTVSDGKVKVLGIPDQTTANANFRSISWTETTGHST